MLSRDEFAGAVRAFKDELSAICLQQDTRHLESVPNFEAELREALQVFRDPKARHSDVLVAACGLIDEFTTSNWDSVVAQCYDVYRLRARDDDNLLD